LALGGNDGDGQKARRAAIKEAFPDG